MSKDQISSDKLKKIILSTTVSRDPSILSSILAQNNISIPAFYNSLFQELTKKINHIFTNENKIDIDYLNLVIDHFGNLCSFVASSDTIIPFTKVEPIITKLLQLSEVYVLGLFDNEKNQIDSATMNLILSTIQKILTNILSCYKKETIDFFILKNTPGINDTLFNSLSNNYQMRKFIYTFFEALKENIKDPEISKYRFRMNTLISNLKATFKPETIVLSFTEAKTIAAIYENDFGVIAKEYSNMILFILHNSQGFSKDSTTDLFTVLLNLVFGTQKGNVSISNFIFEIYHVEINSSGNTCEIIINSLKNHINSDRYEWMVTSTNFIETFINTFPIQREENVINTYFEILFKFCDSKKGKSYLPKEELSSIISHFSEYNTSNSKTLTTIINNIKTLIEKNIEIINIILNYCDYFKYSIPIIENKKSGDSEIKNALLSFTEFILNTNNNKYDYKLPMQIKNFENEASLKSNSISLEYEKDPNTYDEKLRQIVQWMLCLLNNKDQYNDIINIGKIIFQSFNTKNFIMLNQVEKFTISSIIQIFLLLGDFIGNNNCEGIVDNYLDMIFEYIKKANLSVIKYKLKKDKNKESRTQVILTCDNIEKILQSLLFCKNVNIKIKTQEYLKKQFFDLSKKIIKSPYALLIVISIFMKDQKHEEELYKSLDLLLNFIKLNQINVKSILMFEIVETIMKIIISRRDEEENETINICLQILRHIIKFFTKAHIMSYLTNIFVLMKKSKTLNLVVKLFQLINESLDLRNENEENYQNIYLSNTYLDNPLICNMLMTDSLFISKEDKYLSFSIFLIFQSIEEAFLDNFYILNLLASNYNLKIFFHKSKLVIMENDHEEVLFDNISSQIPLNENCVFSIEIEKEKQELTIIMNNKALTEHPFKLEKFNVEFFNVSIGYKKENFINENQQLNFIEISEFYCFNDNISVKPKPSQLITKFIFEKISVIHSQNIEKLYPILNDLGYKNNENKYTSYVKFNNINNLANKNSNCYLISDEDNLSNFISVNGIFQLENIHWETIQNFLFIRYGINKLVKNSFFIQEIFNFLYIEEINTNEDFFIEIITIMVKVALINKNEELLKQNLEELKIIFQKKLEFFEKKLFLENIFEIFKKNENFFGFILSGVFLDEILFDKLSEESQKFIVFEIKNSFINLQTEGKISNKISEQIIDKLSNLLCHFEMKNEDLVNNMVNNVLILYDILFRSDEKEEKEKYEKQATFYLNLINTYDEVILEHMKIGNKVQINEDESKEIFFLNPKIKSQIDNLSQHLYRLLIKINPNLFQNETIKNKTKSKNSSCEFCSFIHTHFKLFFTNIQNTQLLHKKAVNYLTKLYLSNKEIQNLYYNNEFTFCLSSKETNSRQRKKFILKPSDTEKHPNIKNNFRYIYSKKYFEKTFNTLRKIFSLDEFLDKKIIDIICDDEIPFEASNCLYIKKMQKTQCVAIITQFCLYVFTNIAIDKKNSLHVVEGEVSDTFWARSDYQEEWDDYFNPDKKTKFFKKETSYEYRNNKFSIKRILFRDMSEIYKRVYLHIENGIEIIMRNGSSYYFVFNKDKRDAIFTRIITNICAMYEEKNRVHNYNILKNDKENTCFYMRYSPFNGGPISNKQKGGISKKVIVKSLVDIKEIVNEISVQWSKKEINNFDYIMFLNTISGRTYNNLSQYFVFPWIIKDFFQELKVSSTKIYRDLKYPIFAQDEERRETVQYKYEMKDEDNKYHCGTFYSTHAFVSYYMIRQCPYSEIALEIQGGHFDSSDRLFHSLSQLSSMDERFQELIPELFYLPELYVNTNSYIFGRTQKKQTVSDVELPPWSQHDPRMFVLIHRKILEHKKVSESLNFWIDMIFGFRQKGKDAVEVYNTYRRACYAFGNKELSKMDNSELDAVLYEAAELGVNPTQLFTKPHLSRENCTWFSKNNLFFDSREKLPNIKIEKIEGVTCSIKSGQIGDVKCYSERKFMNNNLGGISSLYSVMMANNKKFNSKSTNPLYKYFVIVNKGKKILGTKYKMYISFHDNVLTIVKPKHNLIYEFKLSDENSDITSVISNGKGNKIVVGFENGNIVEYKLKIKSNTYVIKEESNAVVTGMSDKKQKKEKVIETRPKGKKLEHNIDPKISFSHFNNNEYILFNTKVKVNAEQNQNEHSNNTSSSSDKNSNTRKHKYYYLSSTGNKSTIPSFSIIFLALNEPNSLLIASDSKNKIYLYNYYSFSLLNTIDFLLHNPYPLKDILPIKSTGDFIVSTFLSVTLFSLNGVPLAELNLTDKVYLSLSPITSTEVACLTDVTLFTGHKNGNLIIWKVKNKDVNSQFDQRLSFQYNQFSSKSFLEEYKYAYKKNRIENLEEYELKRKFDIIITMNMSEIATSPLIYMKLSFDMTDMVIFDKEQKVYMLTGNLKDNILNQESPQKPPEEDNDIFNFDTAKLCKCCGKEISDSFEERESMFNDNIIERGQEEEKVKITNKETDDNLCEECSQVLNNSDYFLYGY